jgi:hypothetical protein
MTEAAVRPPVTEAARHNIALCAFASGVQSHHNAARVSKG